MNAGIFGPYKAHSQVLQQIQKLKEEGYEAKDITVIADTEERLLLEKQEKVQFETLEEQHHFLQAIKNSLFFKSVKEADLEEVKQLLDVSDEEAELYYKQLKEGNIFIYIGPDNLLDFEDSVYDENVDPIIRIDTEGL